MKQTIFENKERSEELLREAIAIWQQDNHGEQLDGLENDPVISMLFSALAYQHSVYDSDVEELKSEVLSDFVETLLPYAESAAMPATAAIEAKLISSVASLPVDETTPFRLGDTFFSFLPVLRTTAYNVSVASVVRLDGRRWKVGLDFAQPLTSLSGFAFAIKNAAFRSLRLRIGGRVVPLIKPWQFSELPFNRCFSIDTLLYNKQHIYNPSSVSLDLFARQDIRLFVIRSFDYPEGTDAEHEELTFEFEGLDSDFEFSKNQLALNAVLLANVSLCDASLSTSQPIVKVAGRTDTLGDQQSRYFLHLLRPDTTQVGADQRVAVRRVAADRFDSHALLRLLGSLLHKYDSDYPAFATMDKSHGADHLRQLRELLLKLHADMVEANGGNTGGVYLKLEGNQKTAASVGVEYLTTAGAAVNDYLTEKSQFNGIEQFDSARTVQIGTPVAGFDERADGKDVDEQARYLVATNDRIVTPMDIKLFCYKELAARYRIERELIRQITVDRRLDRAATSVGYEIVTDVTLADNSFVRRNFAPRIPMVELCLEKMIAVRSANIYPVRICINIENQ